MSDKCLLLFKINILLTIGHQFVDLSRDYLVVFLLLLLLSLMTRGVEVMELVCVCDVGQVFLVIVDAYAVHRCNKHFDTFFLNCALKVSFADE